MSQEKTIMEQADLIIKIQEAISKFPIPADILSHLEKDFAQGHKPANIYVWNNMEVLEWFLNLKKLLLASRSKNTDNPTVIY